MRDQLQRRGLVGWQMVFGDGQVQADAEDNADAFRCSSHISGTSCTVRDGSCGKRNHFGEHAAQFLAVDENVVRPFEHDVLAERAAAIADGRDNRVARLAAGDHLQPAVDGRVPHNRRRHADHQGDGMNDSPPRWSIDGRDGHGRSVCSSAQIATISRPVQSRPPQPSRPSRLVEPNSAPLRTNSAAYVLVEPLSPARSPGRLRRRCVAWSMRNPIWSS